MEGGGRSLTLRAPQQSSCASSSGPQRHVFYCEQLNTHTRTLLGFRQRVVVVVPFPVSSWTSSLRCSSAASGIIKTASLCSRAAYRATEEESTAEVFAPSHTQTHTRCSWHLVLFIFTHCTLSPSLGNAAQTTNAQLHPGCKISVDFPSTDTHLRTEIWLLTPTRSPRASYGWGSLLVDSQTTRPPRMHQRWWLHFIARD